MNKNVRRLFQEFQPTHYIIDLRPNRSTMTFEGTIIVTGKKVGRPSQRITLHQKDLSIISSHVTHHSKHGDEDIKVVRANTHKSYDEVRLHTDRTLYPGSYTISINFRGKITPQMNGIYPCNFTLNGQHKQLIATQFESHHAREAFPCIDEPEAKATFDLTLTTPAGETVIANTPIKAQTENGGLATTTFETTPKMSTYLLAFVYGELTYKEAKTKDGVMIRTYATPENSAFTDFALDTAVKCLEFYNDYFAIPYPLKKCDLIALPDFASGAMENWGCITFREQSMLVDPANSSIPAKQYVAMVVAHELAHQWFGNLVTMRWWTDLWLNEGFASWIEFLAIDYLYPQWQMWTQFIVDEQQAAMRLDILKNTHPIEVPIHHPDEIRTIFDTISYSKGASVIHMLYTYLGPEPFRDGLRYYLKKYQHANTDTTDLWSALEEISEKPVQAFMNDWTSRSGMPLLKSTITPDSIRLSQERFYVTPDKPVDKTELWPIPLLGSEPILRDSLLTDLSSVIQISPSNSRTLLNEGRSGFYRTTYNSSHLQALGRAIKTGHISPIDRLGLLSDAFETAKAGYTKTDDAFSLLEYYREEDNAAVWEVVASAIGSTKATMDDDDLRENIKPYVRQLVSKQVERLGWEQKTNEPYFDKLLRPTILGMAATSDTDDIINQALTLFKAIRHASDVNPDLQPGTNNSDVRRGGYIDPDLRGIIYGTAVRFGGVAEFEKLLKMHNETNLSEERVTIAAAITGFRQAELVEQALSLIDTPAVRVQDITYWIAYSFMNRHAKQATWEWMKKHWQWLEKNLGTDLSFYRLPIYAARSFSDEEFLEDYKRFFKPKMSPALERSYLQGIEMVRWQAAWKKRDLIPIKLYFKKYIEK